MLNEPQTNTDADHESVVSLLDTYPYFLPARYIDAAEQHKKQPFSESMMTKMRLYMGNWLLFWHYLRTAAGGEEHTKYYQEFAMEQEENEEERNEEDFNTEPEYEIDDIENVEEPDNEYSSDDIKQETITAETDDTLILPIYTEDYFLHQGVHISNDIPQNVEHLNQQEEDEDEDKSLMVVMSFSEWLTHFKTRNEKAKEEEEDQKALKTMWQKGKLAAALEEENEEIPEAVFEMAVNSITKEEDLISEPLAEIHIKQGKYDKAIEMYRKLSLRNPQKSAYFARKIDAVIKEKQS